MIVQAIALLFAAAGPTTSCPVDGARYELRDAPGFTASFREVPDAPSARRLVLDIRSRATGRLYSFRINRGNGYGEATLLPLGGRSARVLEIYTVNDGGRFTDFFGDSDAVAPRSILIPKLGPALWYEADALAGETRSAATAREAMPRAFFDRVACG